LIGREGTKGINSAFRISLKKFLENKAKLLPVNDPTAELRDILAFFYKKIE